MLALIYIQTPIQDRVNQAFVGAFDSQTIFDWFLLIGIPSWQSPPGTGRRQDGPDGFLVVAEREIPHAGHGARYRRRGRGGLLHL